MPMNFTGESALRARCALLALAAAIAGHPLIASADASTAPGSPVIWNSAGIPGLTTTDLTPSLYARVPTPFTALVAVSPLPTAPVPESDTAYALLAAKAPDSLAEMSQSLADAYKTLPANATTRAIVVIGVPSPSGPGIITNTNDANDGGGCPDPDNCAYYTISNQVTGGGLKCVGPSIFGFCLTGEYLPTVDFMTDQTYDLFTDQAGRTDTISYSTSHYFDDHSDNWSSNLQRTVVQGDPATYDGEGTGEWQPVGDSISIPGGVAFDISPRVTVTSDFCIDDAASLNGLSGGVYESGFEGDFHYILGVFMSVNQNFTDSGCGVA